MSDEAERQWRQVADELRAERDSLRAQRDAAFALLEAFCGNIRTDPRMGGELRNPAIRDRSEMCELLLKARALLRAKEQR